MPIYACNQSETALAVLGAVPVPAALFRRLPGAWRYITATSGAARFWRGVGISIALLTQVEGEAYARAGLLLALGVVLWLVNLLALRRDPQISAKTP